MKESYDVAVVGAGTAGTYISWLLAKNGISVVLIEKDEKGEVGKRLDVIHFETDRIEKAGIPPFKVGDPDCIEIRDTSIVGTPDFKTKIKIRASLYATSFYEKLGYKKTTGTRPFYGFKIQPMSKKLWFKYF